MFDEPRLSIKTSMAVATIVDGVKTIRVVP
jgi:hypothetical protein